MAKQLYLIRAQSNDGGRSEIISGRLTTAGLSFISLTYLADSLPWAQISYVPCVVIEVDGTIYKCHTDRDEGFSISKLTTDWVAAPMSLSTGVYVDLITKRWAGGIWVVETLEFIEGDKIRIEAAIRNPDGTVYTGPGSNLKYRVPIFVGRQDAPNSDGSQVVVATDEQAAILPLKFTSGVAIFDFVPLKPLWFCAVPGKTSKWLKTLIARVVVTKAA